MQNMQPTKLIIDRIEGDIARCEDQELRMRDMPLAELPAGVHEGAVLVFDDNRWVMDEKEEAQRRERINKKMDQLFR